MTTTKTGRQLQNQAGATRMTSHYAVWNRRC